MVSVRLTWAKVRRVEDWLAAAWVADEIWELRPDYAALLVVAENLRPGPSDETSDALLTAAEHRARAQLGSEAPEEIKHLAQWRDAFRGFGAKPQRTRPSVEALLRRVDAGLPRIDRITDAYNAVSVACLLPVGGEDLARYTGPARLVRAAGDENFDTTASGQPAVEHPDPGEVIWRDDRGVTCRRWNWRQCVRTRITTLTTTALFVLDGLAAAGPSGLCKAQAELTEFLTQLSPQARFTARLLQRAQDFAETRPAHARLSPASSPPPSGLSPVRDAGHPVPPTMLT
jgi:DNA/RNA-binding domain of Phe-tRNA-synthetase-like protein